MISSSSLWKDKTNILYCKSPCQSNVWGVHVRKMSDGTGMYQCCHRDSSYRTGKSIAQCTSLSRIPKENGWRGRYDSKTKRPIIKPLSSGFTPPPGASGVPSTHRLTERGRIPRLLRCAIALRFRAWKFTKIASSPSAMDRAWGVLLASPWVRGDFLPEIWKDKSDIFWYGIFQ